MFSWGNKASLWDTPKSAGINVRERVLEHYRTLYSAERMTLFLVGGQDLDTLQVALIVQFDLDTRML